MKVVETIIVDNVDIELLREQRNFLLEMVNRSPHRHLDGLINLLDDMLDYAEVEE